MRPSHGANDSNKFVYNDRFMLTAVVSHLLRCYCPTGKQLKSSSGTPLVQYSATYKEAGVQVTGD